VDGWKQETAFAERGAGPVQALQRQVNYRPGRTGRFDQHVVVTGRAGGIEARDNHIGHSLKSCRLQIGRDLQPPKGCRPTPRRSARRPPRPPDRTAPFPRGGRNPMPERFARHGCVHPRRAHERCRRSSSGRCPHPAPRHNRRCNSRRGGMRLRKFGRVQKQNILQRGQHQQAVIALENAVGRPTVCRWHPDLGKQARVRPVRNIQHGDTSRIVVDRGARHQCQIEHLELPPRSAGVDSSVVRRVGRSSGRRYEALVRLSSSVPLSSVR
jgi:hypothetical protein